MRRLLTGLLLAAALAGTAAAAQPARVLAVEWEAGGGKLRWVSPTTLRPVGPAALNVGGAPANIVAVSPDKKLAAVGGGVDGRLRFVELATLRQRGLLWLRGGSVLGALWPHAQSPRRPPRLTPRSRWRSSILRRDASSTDEKLDGRGDLGRSGRRPAADAADAARPDRTCAARGDRRRRLGPDGCGPGHHGRNRASGEARQMWRGSRRRGWPRTARARSCWDRSAWSRSTSRASPCEQQRLDTRTTARSDEADRGLVAEGRLAAAGTRSRIPVGRPTPPASRRRRASASSTSQRAQPGCSTPKATSLSRAGSTLLVHGAGPLRGFALDGTPRFELLAGEDTGYVQVAGRYAYVGSGNSTRFAVVDVTTGRIVGLARTDKPTVVLQP